MSHWHLISQIVLNEMVKYASRSSISLVLNLFNQISHAGQLFQSKYETYFRTKLKLQKSD